MEGFIFLEFQTAFAAMYTIGKIFKADRKKKCDNRQKAK
jgi:hypothetical protein